MEGLEYCLVDQDDERDGEEDLEQFCDCCDDDFEGKDRDGDHDDLGEVLFQKG